MGSGKQLLAIKVLFCINKSGFQGLIAGLATHSSFPFLKADIYDVLSLKIEQLFYLKFFTFHSFIPIINCTKFEINHIFLTVLSGVRAKIPLPPPPHREKKLKMP